MSNVASLHTPTSTKLRFALRLIAALVGGSLAYLVFPRLGIWPLMFVMVGLIYVSARGLRFWRSVTVGLIAGFTFFASQTFWLSMYLGPEPLIALSLLQAIIFACFFASSSALVTKLARHFSGVGLAIISAAVSAIFWVAREWFSGNYPYGGFPWARLVSSQTETSISRLVWLGGMPLADFFIVFAVVLGIELLIIKPSLRNGLLASASLIGLTVLPMTLPLSAKAEDGNLKIASAQGNANAGLFSNRESGRIFMNHIRATNQLLETGQRFDVLVWPENAVDLDLFGNPNNFRELENLVNRINRPLIFGTVTQRDKLYNTSVLWLPKKGMTDWYDKTKPVPFAEYVPDRAFWGAIAPDLIGLLSYDFAPGSRDGLFEVKGKKLGTLICFEIAVDDVPRNLVNGGAEVILSQTNNSDFGRSDEAYQQLAIAKLRAIETGRSLVNISTVGPSAVYLADGTQVSELKAFTRGFMNTEVPLRTSKTPAMFIVEPFTWFVTLTALALTLYLAISNLLPRRRK